MNQKFFLKLNKMEQTEIQDYKQAYEALKETLQSKEEQLSYVAGKKKNIKASFFFFFV